MALNPPKITFPTTAEGFSTNADTVTLAGTTDLGTTSILVNGSSGDVVFTSGNLSWSFFAVLVTGENNFQVRAVDDTDAITAADELLVIKTEQVEAIVDPPTGIRIERFKDSVKVSIVENVGTNVVGYNFYGAEEAGGGDAGFTLLNTTLVTAEDETTEEKTEVSNTFQTVGTTRTTTIVEEINVVKRFAFTHDKNVLLLGNLPLREANNYVATAIAFDSLTLEQVESPFSAELSGQPLILDTEIRNLDKREKFDVRTSVIDQIISTQEKADPKAGTVIENIFVSPASTEFARLYCILNFIHISHSILTLNAFDDPNEDGVSDDVLTTTAKNELREALLVPETNAADVQTLIDSAFDVIASNANVLRKAPEAAIGKALFFWTRTTTSVIAIQSGAIIETDANAETGDPAISFEVPVGITIDSSEVSSFFNSTRNRFELSLDIRAVTAGADGNVAANTIVNNVSGVDGIFSVTNETTTNFGTDLESNSSLARRASLAYVSVDTGTEAGYLSTTLETAGVQQARIEKAGDDLMLRDIDPLRLIHIGGKVDIYVQGESPKEFSDVFSFKYASVSNEFAIIQSTLFFQIRSTNTEINIDQPIFNVTNVRNVTKNANYDLSNLSISGNGDVIDIDESIGVNISIGLAATDVIQISYSFRKTESVILKNQPVDRVVKIEGPVTGVLTTDNFDLIRLEDPLEEGSSTIASDSIKIKFVNSIPTGDLVAVADESHQLIAENTIELSQFGAEIDSIIVQNEAKTTTYVKNTDYLVEDGGVTAATTIKRTPTGGIPDLSTVLISYSAGENFTITYEVNSLLQEIQTKIDEQKHLTADVILKKAVETKVDIDLVVVLKFGVDQQDVDNKIRTNISNKFASKGLGEPIFRSDIVDTIHDVNGISHVVLPIPKMVRADNSLVIKEAINSEGIADHLETVVKSYITLPLKNKTVENGAAEGQFSIMYEDDIPLTKVTAENDVSQASGRFFIRSTGEIIFSTRINDLPDSHAYSATYNVFGEEGSKDIDVSSIEFVTLGALNITFDTSSATFRGF